MTPIIAVTGTGTEIGKTFVASALVAAWSLAGAERGLRIAGIKPIESGEHEEGSDIACLGRVSTFHVTRFTPPYLLMDPVSPHLSARREQREIDLSRVIAWVSEIRALADGVVVELPGGLFSPLRDDGTTNLDLIKALAPTGTLLVAPDRLGVLHDVLATTRAARDELVLDALVLSAPPQADPSTGTNRDELDLLLGDRNPRLRIAVPRCTVEVATRLVSPILNLVT